LIPRSHCWGINTKRAEEIQRYNSEEDGQVKAVYARFEKKPPPEKIAQKGKYFFLQGRHQHLLFAPPSQNCLPFRRPKEEMKMSFFEGG
jgi:hypothetical protein